MAWIYYEDRSKYIVQNHAGNRKTWKTIREVRQRLLQKTERTCEKLEKAIKELRASI